MKKILILLILLVSLIGCKAKRESLSMKADFDQKTELKKDTSSADLSKLDIVAVHRTTTDSASSDSIGTKHTSIVEEFTAGVITRRTTRITEQAQQSNKQTHTNKNDSIVDKSKLNRKAHSNIALKQKAAAQTEQDYKSWTASISVFWIVIGLCCIVAGIVAFKYFFR